VFKAFLRSLAMCAAALVACAAAVAPSAASAQDYPNRPIRLIVGFPAGGPTDALSRSVAKHLSDVLNTPVVVDNRAGASGIIGTAAGAQAPADGYTLLLGTSGAILTGPVLQKLPYSAPDDFSPIGMLGSFPNVLLVPANSPIRSLQDLISEAKKRPGKLSYGSSGVGTTLHLSMALLQTMAGVDVVHVPYKDTNIAAVDMLEGRLDFAFLTTPQSFPLVQGGRMRALATTGAKRSPGLPNVPTVAELGYPGYTVDNWYSILAPKGTPPEIVAKLNRSLNAALAQPGVKEKLASDLDFAITPSSPRQLRDFIIEEQKRWGHVIKTSNIVVN